MCGTFTSKYMGDGLYQDSIMVIMKGLNIQLMKIQTILTTIDLSRNNFGGEIPEVIEKLKSLKGLNFSHNMLLRGTIPSTLGNLSNLEWLDLSHNKLSACRSNLTCIREPFTQPTCGTYTLRQSVQYLQQQFFCWKFGIMWISTVKNMQQQYWWPTITANVWGRRWWSKGYKWVELENHNDGVLMWLGNWDLHRICTIFFLWKTWISERIVRKQQYKRVRRPKKNKSDLVGGIIWWKHMADGIPIEEDAQPLYL